MNDAVATEQRGKVTEAEFWKIQDPRRAEVFSSDDAKEGPRAFAQKREPDWTGR